VPRTRVALIAVLLLLGVLATLSIRSARALCAGPVDAYAAIAAARDQQRRQAAETDAGSENGDLEGLRAIGASMVAGAIDLVLVVKQSDLVAFPAHAVVGTGLELAGCDRAAIADQWRKAARHAWADWPAAVTAEALARDRGARPGEETAASWLAGDAAEQPWFAPNLERVARHYRSATPP
jgi:hypothetical protein